MQFIIKKKYICIELVKMFVINLKKQIGKFVINMKFVFHLEHLISLYDAFEAVSRALRPNGKIFSI